MHRLVYVITRPLEHKRGNKKAVVSRLDSYAVCFFDYLSDLMTKSSKVTSAESTFSPLQVKTPETPSV